MRDRKSFNGTYVNGRCIGDLTSMSSGHLLDQGDAIEILPHWKFAFKQQYAPRAWPLSPLQLEECQVCAAVAVASSTNSVRCLQIATRFSLGRSAAAAKALRILLLTSQPGSSSCASWLMWTRQCARGVRRIRAFAKKQTSCASCSMYVIIHSDERC